MDSVATTSETTMKKTLGRRRIPIRKIENKPSRHVTFSKRRAGLFKKASELSALCGSEIAVIVFSESGNAFSFGHPTAESVIQRYVSGSNSPNSVNPMHAQSACNGIRKFGNNEEVIQWENRVGSMGLNELQLYADCLQKIRDAVAVKAASMASTSGYVADQNQVCESDHGNQKSDLLVLDNCSDVVNCDLTSDQENQKLNSDDLLVQDYCFDDVKCDQGKQKSSTDDLKVQDSCFDDVNWGDIETDMANSPVISPDFWKPDKAESQYNYMDFGDWTMEHSDALPSSSCLEVDAQFESSLCGIQWEKEEDGFDLFASSLQGLLST